MIFVSEHVLLFGPDDGIPTATLPTNAEVGPTYSMLSGYVCVCARNK